MARLPFLRRAVTAAAVLLLGVGLGRWAVPGAARRLTLEITPEQFAAGYGVPQEAVEALARAQVLVDLALPYMNDLQEVLAGVMRMQVSAVSADALAATREQARGLLGDGRTLKRLLDADMDGALLAAIARSEVFLEEIAALDGNNTGAGLRLVQEIIRTSGLQDRLATVNVEESVSAALEASGWVGAEEALGTDDMQ